jgi:hypothetical protein
MGQYVVVQTIFAVIRKELEAIAAEYPDRFKVWYTLDRPGSGKASAFFCYPFSFQSPLSSPRDIAKHAACNRQIPHAVTQPALIFKQIHFQKGDIFLSNLLTGTGYMTV